MKEPGTAETTSFVVLLRRQPAISAAVHRIFSEVAAAPDGTTVTPGLSQAYQELNAALNLGEGGAGAAPGDDREPFDAQRIVDTLASQPQSFGGFELGGLLAPLRATSFIRPRQRR